MDTKAVFEHHLASLSNGDVEAILQDFTEESVLLTAEAVYKGRDALRGYFAAAVAGPFKPGTYAFTMDVVRIEGAVAYCVWHAQCTGAEIALGTDTFVVRDGKIATQTFAAKIDPA